MELHSFVYRFAGRRFGHNAVIRLASNNNALVAGQFRPRSAVIASRPLKGRVWDPRRKMPNGGYRVALE